MVTGLFASLSVERAWEKLSSFLRVFSMAPSSSSSASQEEADLEELKKLERTMRRIRATLHDAEEHWNIREESAKLRLKELKDLAYDIEDVVDEYEYEVDRCKSVDVDPHRSAGITNTGKRKYQMELEDYWMDTGAVAVPSDLVVRASKITERFNEIIHYSEHLSLSENDGERRFAPDISTLRHTSSVVFEKSILGREQDRDEIIDRLLSRKGENAGNPVSVMAIVGMGGLGKTTLAQLVYNSPRVRQSFEKHAWVCVSENFDIETITKNIITSISREQCMYTELADLQRELAAEMNGRRVFLVLDDVWNEQRDCWELFCAPMTAAKICQIIVTTRSELVAMLVQTMPFYPLDCLSFDESWSLFCKAVLTSEQESDDIPTNLIKIGKSIVTKCKGLPLAIKTLGSMLHCENEESRWMDVLESELWDLKEPRNEILAALELSYRHMPIYLRRCFLSLSLFPKDYQLYPNEVLHLWKLLDLLDSDGSDDECKIGQRYLKEFVGRSILQVDDEDSFSLDKDDDEDSYLLHDLIHDLACFFAGEEFYRIKGTLTEIPQNVRYLSIYTSRTPSCISVFPHSLRAIRIEGYNVLQLPEAWFSSCEKLRALDINHMNMFGMALPDGGMALPDGVGHLKLLRHLYVQIDHNIYRPADTSIHHVRNLVLSGIEHLTRLHTLPDIYISRHRCSLNIRELRNLNNIRELSVIGLNNVRHAKYAIEAQLKNKEHLRSLMLSFINECDDWCECGMHPEPVTTIPHDQLLDSLRPHNNLRRLEIFGYDSGKYPSWLGDASFSMLTRIAISGGDSKHLPKLGGLPCLKYLIVQDMQYMECVSLIKSSRQHAGDKEFSSLTELRIQDMPEWSEWCEAESGGFSCLDALWLSCCPKLSSLPLGQFQSLVTLNLVGCGRMALLPACPALRELCTRSCHALREIPSLPSLEELDISYCPSLISIGSVTYDPLLTILRQHSVVTTAACSLPKLKTLNLMGCPNLCAVGSVPSLTILNLYYGLNDELMYSPSNDFCSLQYLNIYDAGFTSMPVKQQSMPSLTRLCISNCRNLQYCDGLPSLTSLEHLEVRQCPKLPIYNVYPPQLKTLSIDHYDDDDDDRSDFFFI